MAVIDLRRSHIERLLEPCDATRITEGAVADREGRLRIGDWILQRQRHGLRGCYACNGAAGAHGPTDDGGPWDLPVGQSDCAGP